MNDLSKYEKSKLDEEIMVLFFRYKRNVGGSLDLFLKFVERRIVEMKLVAASGLVGSAREA